MPKTNIMKVRLGDCCMVCNKKRADVGLRVLTTFICNSCEEQLVQINETDEQYDTYVKQMRTLSSNFTR
ncbi:sigma factor G inhibitor Gin [Halalkalibacter wakoensis]|nr:sigma factor G inhibitor Gin [Halalkalibacter wakoensis]